VQKKPGFVLMDRGHSRMNSRTYQLYNRNLSIILLALAITLVPEITLPSVICKSSHYSYLSEIRAPMGTPIYSEYLFLFVQILRVFYFPAGFREDNRGGRETALSPLIAPTLIYVFFIFVSGSAWQCLSSKLHWSTLEDMGRRHGW